MTTLPRSQTKASPTWSKALAQPAAEFPRTALPLLEGRLPTGLRGTLYRNGPGRLQRSGEKVGHWFDGDGAVLAVSLGDGNASATYRYVRTSQFATEELADQYLYSGYGMRAPGPLWKRWTTPVKNAANTSVLALGDRLLALWEGGNPHAMDLETLRTLGHDDLDGALAGKAYSAHPKVDPATGDIYNFGVAPGLNSTLNLYRSDSSGRVQQSAQITLDGTPLVHDFALAGPYLVVCAPPTRIDLLPVGLGLKPFSDSIQWKPELGTQIYVIDKTSLSVVGQSVVDPWFQWHVSNAYLDQQGGQNRIVLDLIRHADFQTNEFLREVAAGAIQTHAQGTYWRLHIDPASGKLLSQTQLIDQGCEFPVVRPQQVGQNADAVYLSIHRPDADVYRDLFGAIARFNPETGDLRLADLGEQRYPSEPIYVEDREESQRGWLLTVVFDGAQEQSEVWIFDADRLECGPVARLGLPGIVPHSFHGTWRPSAAQPN